MLVGSLLRSGFAGDIKVIHNGETEIFEHPRRGVEEIGVDYPQGEHGCYCAKFHARKLLPAEAYDWVLFMDCDMLVTAPLDAWFETQDDIRYAPEDALGIQCGQFNGYLTDEELATLQRPGINSGTFLIRGGLFHEVMERWETLHEQPTLRHREAHDQPAWNRLMLDTQFATGMFRSPSLTFVNIERDFFALLRSPVVHFCGMSTVEKTVLMQALYLTRFHGADDGRLLEVLER